MKDPEVASYFQGEKGQRCGSSSYFFLSVIAAHAGLAALKSAGGEMRREQR